LLVHAAAGVVGGFAIKLAKAAKAFVIGTCSPTNKRYVLKLGVDEGKSLGRPVKNSTFVTGLKILCPLSASQKTRRSPANASFGLFSKTENGQDADSRAEAGGSVNQIHSLFTA
jgi:hypothetical protein